MKRDPQQGGTSHLCPQLQPFSEAPEQTPDKSPPESPSSPAHSHAPQNAGGLCPRGPSHCDRQRPLPCPTATPPRLPSSRGSTIGGGRGKDAQMRAPEQRGSAAEATRAPSHPERRGPGAQSPRYHTDLSGIRESRTNNPSEQTPAHQTTPLLGGKQRSPRPPAAQEGRYRDGPESPQGRTVASPGGLQRERRTMCFKPAEKENGTNEPGLVTPAEGKERERRGASGRKRRRKCGELTARV